MTDRPDDEHGYYASLAMQARIQSETRMSSGPIAYPVGRKLGFFGSLRAGMQIVPTCWRVLASDPQILVVPFVVLIMGAAIALSYAAMLGGLTDLARGGRITVLVKMFPLTVILSVLGTIGQAVVVAAAAVRLEGGQARLATAWTRAVLRLPHLLAFGVVLAGERTVTNFLRSFRGLRLLADLTDRAWDFATFLAVPAIVFEDLGPFAAVKRSGALVKSRWGVQLTATGVITLTLFVAALPLVFIGVFALTLAVPVGLLVLVVVFTVIVSVSSALNGVFAAAMYRFATTGVIRGGFTEADMWAVLSRK